MIRLVRRLALLALVAFGTLGLRRIVDRRATLERVADDLRSPVLYAIPSVRSDRTLRLVRRLGDLGSERQLGAGRRGAARPARA